MNFLFVHNNFPAQFRNLVEALGADPSHRIAAIGADTARDIPNVALSRYNAQCSNFSSTHPFARRFDAECRRAEKVLFAASALAESGFSPDFIFAHCGWGEAIPLRAIFPDARLVIYCEYFYRATGQDVHFDPEAPTLGADGVAALQCKNAATLLALADSDIGISPTDWQRSTFPTSFHDKIRVIHEGVDLTKFRPDQDARFVTPGGKVLTQADEVVTFVSRNLEPLRGYHVFLRALPDILRARPNAQVVIAGGDGCSYSHPPPPGTTWKAHYLDQVLERLDLSRVHFVGHLPYASYASLLRVSSAHVYLTYPFVLSWSLLEAMATECPIIASDTPPVREVIEHGVNGLLVPFLESTALAQTVIETLANRRNRAHARKAARETIVARYEKSRCVNKTLEAIGLGAPEFPGRISPLARGDRSHSSRRAASPALV